MYLYNSTMYLYDSTVGQKLETVPWLSLSLKICKTVPVGLEEGSWGAAAWAEPWSLGSGAERERYNKAQPIRLSNFTIFASARDAEGCRAHSSTIWAWERELASYQGLGPKRLWVMMRLCNDSEAKEAIRWLTPSPFHLPWGHRDTYTFWRLKLWFF